MQQVHFEKLRVWYFSLINYFNIEKIVKYDSFSVERLTN